MKKTVVALLALLLLFSLTACGSKTKKTVCTYTSTYGSTNEITVTSKGSEMIKVINAITYKGLDPDSAEANMKDLKASYAFFDDIEGVSTVYKLNNAKDQITLSLTIDLQKLDFAAFEKEMGEYYDDPTIAFKADNLDLAKYIDGAESQGYVCK